MSTGHHLRRNQCAAAGRTQTRSRKNPLIPHPIYKQTPKYTKQKFPTQNIRTHIRIYDSTHKLQEPTEEMVEAGHMAAWSLPEAERLSAASTVACRGTVVHATQQRSRDPYQERWREAIIIEHRGGQLRPRRASPCGQRRYGGAVDCARGAGGHAAGAVVV